MGETQARWVIKKMAAHKKGRLTIKCDKTNKQIFTASGKEITASYPRGLESDRDTERWEGHEMTRIQGTKDKQRRWHTKATIRHMKNVFILSFSLYISCSFAFCVCK